MTSCGSCGSGPKSHPASEIHNSTQNTGRRETGLLGDLPRNEPKEGGSGGRVAKGGQTGCGRKVPQMA